MKGLAACGPDVLRLAEAAGIAASWRDVHGQMHQVGAAALLGMLDVLGLPCATPAQISESLDELDREAMLAQDGMVIVQTSEPVVFRHSGSLDYQVTLEHGERCNGLARQVAPGKVSIPAISQPGYHRLAIGNTQLHLAVCPSRAPSVSELTGRRPARAWGLAVQVSSLRQGAPVSGAPMRHDPRSMPLHAWPGWETGGDYGALARLACAAAAQGASALAISPVHAMFSADPRRYSPYSPSSRLFLNAAYIEPSLVLGEAAVLSALAESKPMNDYGEPASPLQVDWLRVLPLRLRLLRRLFENFYGQGSSRLLDQFRQFRLQGGDALESHARYEALHADLAGTLGPQSGWQDWPGELHNPAGSAVREYAWRHEREVTFHVFLQWLADGGMRHAQNSARSAGMPIGLIADMAIGADPRGSHAWSRQADILPGVSLGAPPDLYEPNGQVWGLAALSPRTLRNKAYAPFIEVLRAALAHAGAVRIDHILGLGRMWLVPDGGSSSDGAYLRYPLDDMLRLVVLEAWRHKALIIGENLGTVPEGFNRRIEEKGILGMGVLWFERQARIEAGQSAATPEGEIQAGPQSGSGAPPAAFHRPASWSSEAIAMSTTHDLPTLNGWWHGRDLQWRERLGQFRGDQAAQQAAARNLDRTALWQALRLAGCVSSASDQPPQQAPHDAILAFVASTPAPLALIPIEDLLGLMEQPNLPGADSPGPVRHPNWTQCLPCGIDDIFQDARVRSSLAAIVQARSAS